MNIIPMPNHVYLKTASTKVGGLDTSSRKSAVEFAEILSVGSAVKRVQTGDKVFVKSWSLDIINHEGQEYQFCDIDTNGILAKVLDESVQQQKPNPPAENYL